MTTVFPCVVLLIAVITPSFTASVSIIIFFFVGIAAYLVHWSGASNYAALLVRLSVMHYSRKNVISFRKYN